MSDAITGQVDASSMKGRIGPARVLHATLYSLAGLRAVWRKEAAFRQLACLNVVLFSLALLLDVTSAERAIMMAVVFLALIVELINSAIEAAIDRISLEIHPLSKDAKDMGSAAQMLSLLLVALVWLVILAF